MVVQLKLIALLVACSALTGCCASGTGCSVPPATAGAPIAWDGLGEPPTADEPYGCEWHPGPATHQRMADALTAHLRTVW